MKIRISYVTADSRIIVIGTTNINNNSDIRLQLNRYLYENGIMPKSDVWVEQENVLPNQVTIINDQQYLYEITHYDFFSGVGR